MPMDHATKVRLQAAAAAKKGGSARNLSRAKADNLVTEYLRACNDPNEVRTLRILRNTVGRQMNDKDAPRLFWPPAGFAPSRLWIHGAANRIRWGWITRCLETGKKNLDDAVWSAATPMILRGHFLRDSYEHGTGAVQRVETVYPLSFILFVAHRCSPLHWQKLIGCTTDDGVEIDGVPAKDYK